MPDRDDLILGHDETPEREFRRHHADQESIRDFAIDAARLIRDRHGEDILLLDVRQVSDVCDYILIASGTSDRQMRSVADDVEELAREKGFDRFGRDFDEATTWIVLDFVDLVVHLFNPTARAHYDLEMLWGDAPKVDWERETTS